MTHLGGEVSAAGDDDRLLGYELIDDVPDPDRPTFPQ
jgi:hypothetical protein